MVHCNQCMRQKCINPRSSDWIITYFVIDYNHIKQWIRNDLQIKVWPFFRYKQRSKMSVRNIFILVMLCTSGNAAMASVNLTTTTTSSINVTTSSSLINITTTNDTINMTATNDALSTPEERRKFYLFFFNFFLFLLI